MYRTIDASLWTDRKVREQLNPQGKLLFVYLITNSHTHVSGLYYLPSLIIQHETGLSARQLDTLSDTLSNSLFARFDRPNELVWVVNMFSFQGRGEKNTLSAAHHLSKDVHKSPLINEFLIRYPHVKPYMKDTLSDGYPPVPLPIPHSPFPITEPEPEKGSSPPTDKRGGRADPAAELFRAAYLANVGNPYEWLAGDFPQFTKLRKRLKIGTVDTPTDWEAALLNYFASPFAEFSLQHFAAKFDTFKNTPLDRFKVPINHAHGGNGNGHQDKQQRNAETARRLLSRLHPEDRSSSDSRVAGSESGGVPGAVAKTQRE